MRVKAHAAGLTLVRDLEAGSFGPFLLQVAKASGTRMMKGSGWC